MGNIHPSRRMKYSSEAHIAHLTTVLWRAKAEEKHMLFARLLVQNKILTADKLEVPSRSVQLEGWWNAAVSGKSKRRHEAALLIYTAWNLWKERNRRVFEGVSQPGRDLGNDQGRSAGPAGGLWRGRGVVHLIMLLEQL
jgi:hypothetical protein